jgi:hypothetical protein
MQSIKLQRLQAMHATRNAVSPARIAQIAVSKFNQEFNQEFNHKLAKQQKHCEHRDARIEKIKTSSAKRNLNFLFNC